MHQDRTRKLSRRGAIAMLCALSAACAPAAAPPPGPAPAPAPEARAARPALIPEPVQVRLSANDSFVVTAATQIVVDASAPEAARIADYLAARLRPATGFALPVGSRAGAGTPVIALRLASDLPVGAEGYRLRIAHDSVAIVANRPAGLFHGVQTLRQLLPAAVEAGGLRRVSWAVPTGEITDYPRYAWRGAMLDVARHFLTVDEVKRFIDELALYKMNTLHLHLADDQGWRIMIDSWPRLATFGGEIEVGGTPGGYYTQPEYSEIVRYAQSRFITIVPEIDMPGHTNAALASYPELNCNGVSPERYTGMNVGFSSLCVDSDTTYHFIDDVVRELAALTPGPFLHIGGDEVRTLTPEQYIRFVNRVQEIVASHGKRSIGWEEIAKADLLPGTVVQSWKTDSATVAVEKGAQIVFSPATHVYLDMKYDSITPLGNRWAGYVSVQESYEWNPATFLPGVPDSLVLGVESPIWSETLWNIHDVEYMAFPRLPGVAEIGWSPQAKRDWEDFRSRLAAQAPRWTIMRLPYFRAPDVPWKE